MTVGKKEKCFLDLGMLIIRTFPDFSRDLNFDGISLSIQIMIIKLSLLQNSSISFVYSERSFSVINVTNEFLSPRDNPSLSVMDETDW